MGAAMPDQQYCTEEDAEKQAEVIREFWRKRNVDVTVWVEDLHTGKRSGGAIYNVRSDIKLGAPVTDKKRRAA
jgi:hypothetical protein